MRIRQRAKQAFTLVEILIVVVILGILAAIVIPQFTSASESAQAASLASQLQTIRSQIELYQVQHGGTYPTGDSGGIDWTKLTTEDADGYGPYLQEAPTHALSGTDDPTASQCWTWNDTDKTIMATIGSSVDTQVLTNAGLEEGSDFPTQQ
jgi:general secretion pathway protein G